MPRGLTGHSNSQVTEPAQSSDSGSDDCTQTGPCGRWAPPPLRDGPRPEEGAGQRGCASLLGEGEGSSSQRVPRGLRGNEVPEGPCGQSRGTPGPSNGFLYWRVLVCGQPRGSSSQATLPPPLATGPFLQWSCRLSVPEHRNPPPLGLVLTGCQASRPELLIQQAWAGPTKSPGELSLGTPSAKALPPVRAGAREPPGQFGSQDPLAAAPLTLPLPALSFEPQLFFTLSHISFCLRPALPALTCRMSNSFKITLFS